MKKRFYMTFNIRVFFTCLAGTLLGVAAVMFIGMNSYVVTNTQPKTSMPLIIIDAGHGGGDGGTQSSSGILEKDINLDISKKLCSVFEMLGYETLMVRNDDSLLSDSDSNTVRQKKVSDIHNRMKIIEEHPDSIFLSIHQNYFTQSKYNGTQVFYSPNNDESRVIAQSIQDSVVRHIQNENERKIKKSGTEIYLLYHAKSPAVMVECGFLSNAGEAQLLNDDEYQRKMALAIADGVIDYLKDCRLIIKEET